MQASLALWPVWRGHSFGKTAAGMGRQGAGNAPAEGDRTRLWGTKVRD